MQEEGFKPSSPEHQWQNWTIKPSGLLSSLSGHNRQLKLIPESGHYGCLAGAYANKLHTAAYSQVPNLKSGTSHPGLELVMSQVSDSGLMLCLPLRCLLESALLCPPCLLCLSHSTDWSLVPGKWQHRWAVQLGSGPNADVLIKNRMNFQEKSRKCLALNLSAGVNPVSHRQDEQWCS